jgi:PPOX class probable F420-dependent enzyme
MGDISLGEATYVSFTTFRKNGSPKATPVWIVDLGDGTVGFTTASSSWKVKRLANDPSATLQPSDARGRPLDGTEPVEGTATVVVGGSDFDRVKASVKAKYGLQYHLIVGFQKLMGLIGRGAGSDSAVIVTVT